MWKAAVTAAAVAASGFSVTACAADGGRSAETGVRAVVEDETARQAAVREAARGGDSQDALKAAAAAEDRSRHEDRPPPP